MKSFVTESCHNVINKRKYKNYNVYEKLIKIELINFEFYFYV